MAPDEAVRCRMNVVLCELQGRVSCVEPHIPSSEKPIQVPTTESSLPTTVPSQDTQDSSQHSRESAYFSGMINI